MVVAYRLNPLTEALLDKLLHVRRYCLVNLLLDQPVVPELVRGDCNPERIAAELGTLIGDERVRSAHREGYDRAMRRLAAGGLSPSRNAADKILAIIAARRRGEPVPQREGVNPR
jgi:lipid-A-disaccharide synthase